MLQKTKPLRDRKYLNSFRDAACYACGVKDETVVAAHIRHGQGGGMGMNPPDDLTLPLCRACHEAQHRVGEHAFWQCHFGGHGVISQDMAVEWAKVCARRRYETWKESQI